MANVYKDRERGQDAERILASPIWDEAWIAYRARILEEIESAPSNQSDTVMHLKRLLSAATAARTHLERIMKEGQFAAKSIDLDEKRGLRKVFG
jgi:uncharacterized protein YecT (DUF1311 family)